MNTVTASAARRLKNKKRKSLPLSEGLRSPGWPGLAALSEARAAAWRALLGGGPWAQRRRAFRTSSPRGVSQTAVHRDLCLGTWVWSRLHVVQSSVDSMTKKVGKCRSLLP